MGVGPVTASAVMTAHRRDDPISKWAHALREKSGWQKAVVALANKNARILWAVFVRGKSFDAPRKCEADDRCVAHRRNGTGIARPERESSCCRFPARRDSEDAVNRSDRR